MDTCATAINILVVGDDINFSGRLASLAIAHATAGNSYSYAYNPAGQLISRGMSNDAYAWTQGVTVNRAYAVNGLNQYTASGAVVPTYDGRGNLTSAGSTAYGYDSRNHLATFGTTTLLYDGLGRLAAQSSPATRFVQQGSDLIAETDASNAILRRYVHGPGTDEVLVWYEGAGTSDKRWLARDERGSTTLITDASATVVGINAYDEYGIPQSTNLGRFQYTGQTWLPELGMYYYKARIYSATLGRFLQTDPIGYDDGPNWYNYAHGDPVNWGDPEGTQAIFHPSTPPTSSTILIPLTGHFESDGVNQADGVGSGDCHNTATCPSDDGPPILVTGSPVENLGGVSVGGGSSIGASYGGLTQNGDGGLQQVGFRPRGGLAGVAREVLRQTFMRALPKIKFPTNAAGVGQAEFGRLSGLSQSDKGFRAFTQTDINAAVERLQGAGITRGDVANAADFYSYNAFRDVGNEAAAFRSYYLQQVTRGW